MWAVIARAIKLLGRVYRLAPRGTPYRTPLLDLTTIPGALEGLKSPNQAVFYKAWHRLHDAGAQAEAALGRVFADMAPDNTRFRARALWLLARIPNRADSWLRQGLKDKDANIRITALRAARQNATTLTPYLEIAVGIRMLAFGAKRRSRFGSTGSHVQPNCGRNSRRGTMVRTVGTSRLSASARQGSGRTSSPPGGRRSARTGTRPAAATSFGGAGLMHRCRSFSS